MNRHGSIELHPCQKPLADPKTTSFVRAAFRANYRLAASTWVGGENVIEVEFANLPHVVSNSIEVWHRKHSWKGTNLRVKVAVSRSWRRTVQARGVAVVDGLLTTHARRLKSEGEVVAYKASWIRQCRGLAVQAESGYLAHHPPSGTSYHAAGGTDRGIAKEVAVPGDPSRGAGRADSSEAGGEACLAGEDDPTPPGSRTRRRGRGDRAA
jgi:hypothetical protein